MAFNFKNALLGASVNPLGAGAGFLTPSSSGLMFQDLPSQGTAPSLAGYQTMRDVGSLSGMAPGQFQAMLQERALATGIAPETARQISQMQAGAQGQAQQGVSSLAQAGGLSSGARARLFSNAANQSQLARQNALFGQQQNQQALQGSLANLEEERRRIDLQNAINREAANVQGLNEYNINKYNIENQRYNQQMSLWAAAKEAADQERLAATTGGLLGRGGILGSGFKLG